MSSLLPCPFCGDSDQEIRKIEHWPVVQCQNCGAIGPCIKLDETEAVGEWNRRAALASGDEVERLRISLFNAIGEVEQQRNALKFMNGVADELKARLKEAEACIRDVEPYVSKGTGSWAAEWHRRHAAAIARSTKA